MKPYSQKITRSFNDEDTSKLVDAGYTVVLNEDGTPKTNTQGRTFVELGVLETDLPETFKEARADERLGETTFVAFGNRQFVVALKDEVVQGIKVAAGIATASERKASQEAERMFGNIKELASEADSEGNPVINGTTVTLAYCANKVREARAKEREKKE